jgi:hypothetical protein
MSKSDAGKTDKRRPAAIPHKKYLDNYENTFKKEKEMKKEPKNGKHKST